MQHRHILQILVQSKREAVVVVGAWISSLSIQFPS
jgi:hypothetical protein